MNVMKQIETILLSTFLFLACPISANGQSTIDPSRFQAAQPQVYTLDHGDTLGVFVEGVVGEVNSVPPVHQPGPGSSLPPALGYPTLVLHDGTIRLPFAKPFNVRGLSVAQVESLLKKTYRAGDAPIITDRSRVLVSLMRKRTVNVMVVRGDQSDARAGNQFRRNGNRAVSARSDGNGRIFNLQMPVGENDLLNAMVESGGVPGINAQPQLQVLRNGFSSNATRQSFPRSHHSSAQATHISSVPIRSDGHRTSFPRSEARLNNGDIVSIAARPTEVFYTGGQLGGGEFAIPRDKALSVLDAIAIAGGIPQAARSLGGVPQQQPRVLTLLRKRGGHQVAYRIDLSNGYSQQAANTQVLSGDYLILDFSPAQRVQNVGIGVFNTWGVRQLLRN